MRAFPVPSSRSPEPRVISAWAICPGNTLEAWCKTVVLGALAGRKVALRIRGPRTLHEKGPGATCRLQEQFEPKRPAPSGEGCTHLSVSRFVAAGATCDRKGSHTVHLILEHIGSFGGNGPISKGKRLVRFQRRGECLRIYCDHHGMPCEEAHLLRLKAIEREVLFENQIVADRKPRLPSISQGNGFIVIRRLVGNRKAKLSMLFGPVLATAGSTTLTPSASTATAAPNTANLFGITPSPSLLDHPL
jgi:hypothetical protein